MAALTEHGRKPHTVIQFGLSLTFFLVGCFWVFNGAGWLRDSTSWLRIGLGVVFLTLAAAAAAKALNSTGVRRSG